MFPKPSVFITHDHTFAIAFALCFLGFCIFGVIFRRRK